MDKYEAAKLFNNLDMINFENLLRENKKILQQSDLVVVYSASDDLCEIDGAIYDEVGINYWIKIDKNGIIEPYESVLKYDEEYMRAWFKRVDSPNTKKIMAYIGYSTESEPWFIIKTDIKNFIHFNILEENGDCYCKAIVFSLKDLEN